MSIEEEHVDMFDDREGVDSRSAAVRDILDEHEELRTECEELRTECEELHTRLDSRENRIDELEEQLAKRSQLEEKIEDLPAKIHDERSYQERRQRMLDQASLTERLKWKVTGVPVDDSDDMDT